MRRRYFASLAGCLLAVGCSVYDASLLSPEGQDAAPTSTGALGGQGGDVGVGGRGGGGAGVESTTTSVVTSSGVGGTGGASSGTGGTGDAPDAAGDGSSSDATSVADGEPVDGEPTAPADAECVHEGTSVFCLRKSANCGDVTGVDNCGTTVTVNCGSCVGRAVCGALGPNLCGNAVNIVRGGTVFSSSPNLPPEDMTAAFDGKTGTKWYAGNTVAIGYIGYDFGAGATHVVSYYTITSANDQPSRDPAAWQLQGSNDGASWTTLDSRAAQAFPARFQTNSYDCAMRGPYRSYRLNVTANSGSTALQLAEIQLFGF